jgi:hypothetical protein
MMMKTSDWKQISLALLAGALLLAGCGESSSAAVGAGGPGGTGGPTVSFSGIAWSFELPGTPYGRIDAATISILEMPELETTSDENGVFTVEGIPVGAEATLVLEHEDHPLTYTKTHTVPNRDLDDLTFQIPTNGLFQLIEAGLMVETDPAKCQMVTTFTRVGKTIGNPGAHGEPGAIASVAPMNNASEGPIYFNDDVLPDRNRSYSSLDGGVLFLNVDPGDYTLSARCVEDRTDLLTEYPPEDYAGESLRCQTEEVEFESILMKCRPGVFLNASPSYGLQALPPAN